MKWNKYELYNIKQEIRNVLKVPSHQKKTKKKNQKFLFPRYKNNIVHMDCEDVYWSNIFPQ